MLLTCSHEMTEWRMTATSLQLSRLFMTLSNSDMFAWLMIFLNEYFFSEKIEMLLEI